MRTPSDITNPTKFLDETTLINIFSHSEKGAIKSFHVILLINLRS